MAMLHKEGANYGVVLSVCSVHLLASPDRQDCLIFVSQWCVSVLPNVNEASLVLHFPTNFG